jgi:hypothetical protein
MGVDQENISESVMVTSIPLYDSLFWLFAYETNRIFM